MSEIIDVMGAIFGGGGALACIGAGVKFIWDKVDARFKALEESVNECRKREEAGKNRSAKQLTVIELLWLALKQVDPENAALARSEKLLNDLKGEDHEHRAE